MTWAGSPGDPHWGKRKPVSADYHLTSRSRFWHGYAHRCEHTQIIALTQKKTKRRKFERVEKAVLIFAGMTVSAKPCTWNLIEQIDDYVEFYSVFCLGSSYHARAWQAADTWLVRLRGELTRGKKGKGSSSGVFQGAIIIELTRSLNLSTAFFWLIFFPASRFSFLFFYVLFETPI